MANSVLSEPYFQDEQAAFDRLEEIIWPDGVVCPHCGTIGRAGALNGVLGKTGKPAIGRKKCYACRRQFTVRVGTVFESSHVPLHIWFQAAFLMASSKKGISSNQLHRTLGVGPRTTAERVDDIAWQARPLAQRLDRGAWGDLAHRRHV